VGELLVLWDVDYTLVNAGGLGTRLYEVVFRAMFGRELPAVAPKAGRTDRAIILDTLALAGVASTGAAVDDFLAALAQLSASGTVRADVRALPGAAAAIDELASIGARQSVLTGNVRPLAALKLGLAGLGDRLDLDVGAYGDVHEVRAELVPAARLAAGRAYGTDFSGYSTVLVGDTPLDVEAALATGARAVGVATGSYSAASLVAAGAHVVLPDLTDAGLVVAAVTGLASSLCRQALSACLAGQWPGGGSRPRWIAVVTAAVRSDTPGLPNARSRWVLTVASLMNSSRPISALVRPRATRARTSVSLADSDSHGGRRTWTRAASPPGASAPGRLSGLRR
jgi:phosphoglycolate phosphatase